MGICCVAGQFDAPVNRARVHDDNFLIQAVEEFLVDPEVQGIFAERREILDLLELKMDAQHIGYVTPMKGFGNIVFNFHPQAANELGQQCRRATDHHLSAEFL